MSEEKTRVLRGATGAEPADAETEGADEGKIVFHCPNGHRIVVAAKFAGKRGKCTKCGVPVAIPGGAAVGAPGPPAVVGPPIQESLAAESFGIGPAGAEAEPSGPELVAEPPFVAATVPGLPPGPPPGPPPASPPPAPPPPEAPAEWNFVTETAPSPGLDASGWAADATGPPSGGDHPTARLVARLWAEVQHGGVVEVHLAGGSVLVPRWFDAGWSRGTHALFGSQAADQSVTLTAVAWDTVQKVVVRQLSELPDDMFT